MRALSLPTASESHGIRLVDAGRNRLTGRWLPPIEQTFIESVKIEFICVLVKFLVDDVPFFNNSVGSSCCSGTTVGKDSGHSLRIWPRIGSLAGGTYLVIRGVGWTRGGLPGTTGRQFISCAEYDSPRPCDCA